MICIKKLPDPSVYEEEFKYMPWGIIINKILGIVSEKTPKNGYVLDAMCGPGYLLGMINNERPDVILEGVDTNEEFILHAKAKYPKITFHNSDILSFAPLKKYDVILCTGGLHHIPYENQEFLIKFLSKLLKSDGFCIFADPYIEDYKNNEERIIAASNLGQEYCSASVKAGAPKAIIEACLDILHNDVMGCEYKTSIRKIKPIFEKTFSFVNISKTWPDSDQEFGDYYIIAKNPSE